MVYQRSLKSDKAGSGELDEDLTDLLLALGEAASEQDSGVAFLIDEVQFLATRELEALIDHLARDHRMDGDEDRA